MKTRKQKELEKVNVLLENRYIHNKFLKEDEEKNNTPKLQVIPVDGKVGKYKISIFQKKGNDNLKDIMTDDILQKLNLKNEYASQESAVKDLEKINTYELEKALK
jgi:hypothetical protein